MRAIRLAVICLVVTASASARGQLAPAAPRSKEATVRELMALTGAANLGQQVIAQMLTPLKQAIPDAPEAFWDSFMAEVNPDELVELVVPVYLKHFTQDDLEQLIAFYKTPLGRKLIASTPSVVQESIAAGQSWGRQVAERAIKKLKASSPPKS